MPKVEPGTYTMHVALNTNTGLGVLSSKREIEIREPFSHRIAPGQAVAINNENQVVVGKFPGADKVSAVFRMYPTRNYLRVRAAVRDEYLSTDAPKDQPWEASSVQLFISAGARDQDITEYIAVPSGEGGIPKLMGSHRHRDVSGDGVISAYKRTSEGYVVQLKIPWKALRGYQPDLKLLPIDTAVNSKTPEGRVLMIFTGPGTPWQYTKDYVGLEIR